jgi:DNA-binding CsgD family transcriptional regulator
MDSIESAGINRLKKVERRIVGDISAGLSTNEIALKRNITAGTVRNYVSSILHKTGLQHRTQIAIYAIQNGLSSTPYLHPKSHAHAGGLAGGHAGNDLFVPPLEKSSRRTRNQPEETT